VTFPSICLYDAAKSNNRNQKDLEESSVTLTGCGDRSLCRWWWRSGWCWYGAWRWSGLL